MAKKDSDASDSDEEDEEAGAAAIDLDDEKEREYAQMLSSATFDDLKEIADILGVTYQVGTYIYERQNRFFSHFLIVQLHTSTPETCFSICTIDFSTAFHSRTIAQPLNLRFFHKKLQTTLT